MSYYIDIPMEFLFITKKMSGYWKFGRSYENLKNCEKELMGQQRLEELKLVNLTPAEIHIYENYKLQYLKKKVIVNYVDPSNIGNKTLKRTWVKALSKTYNWSFNTFVVGIKGNKIHPLNGQIDVLLMIQDFVNNKDTLKKMSYNEYAKMNNYIYPNTDRS